MKPEALEALKTYAKTLASLPSNGDGYTYTITGLDGSPYLTRTLFPRVGDARPLFHQIHRPDRDRHLHNHPWETASFLIVSGSYTEERLVDGKVVTRLLCAGDVNELNAGTFHRIAEIHGEVYTFGIIGKRVQEWGFLVDGNVVPHSQYKEHQ